MQWNTISTNLQRDLKCHLLRLLMFSMRIELLLLAMPIITIHTHTSHFRLTFICIHIHFERMPKRKLDAHRLSALGRQTFASRSAIANLLASVRKDGLPETFDRRSQFRARKEVARTATPYGPIVKDVAVPLANGQEMQLSLQCPFAFCHFVCEHSPDYARIFEEALSKHPCSPATPWNILLYQDTCDPSDMGVKHHTRKTSAWYWSFLEFGMFALSHEEVWGTACTIRMTEVNKLQGDISQVMYKVLELFHGEHHDVRRSGFTVVVNSKPVHIVASITNIFGDEPAIKEMVSCKGHAGVKPCLLCINVVLHHVIDTVASAVSIASIDWSAFKLHTDATIRAVIRRINTLHGEMLAGRISQTEVNERSSALGWNYTPCEIILNERFGLGIASSVMWDWAHEYVHDGLGDHEFGAVMKVLSRWMGIQVNMYIYINILTQ